MDFSNILIESNTTYILLREIYRNLAVGMFLTARNLVSRQPLQASNLGRNFNATLESFVLFHHSQTALLSKQRSFPVAFDEIPI